MKNIFYLFLITFFIVSCNSDEPKNVKRTVIPFKLITPLNNANLQKGAVLTIKVSRESNEEIKSLKLFTEDTLIFNEIPQNDDMLFEINTGNWKTGTHQITLETVTKGGRTHRNQRIIKILPNIFPRDYTVEVIKTYPHNVSFYTQGLEFDGDQLYEGTGKSASGKSVLAKVDYKTGEIQKKITLDEKYFGEGITILDDEIFQLTWQEYTCFVYDKNTLEEVKRFTYTGEGWGLCNDGTQLIMSDGTERIYFRDPKNFNINKTIEVYTNMGPVKGINELEYIDGKIYANVYTTNQIVIIDPETGVVTGKIDASLMALDYRKTGEVLNGIAYKEDTKQLFLTGKNWPDLLEVKLIEE